MNGEADDGQVWDEAAGLPRQEPTPQGTDSAEEALPFTEQELRRALRRPDLAMEYALGGAERLRRNLSTGRHLWWLVGLLLATSLLAAVPYGAVPPTRSFWRIAALFTGSLFICFPCLHVFSQFLGFRFRLAQNLALSLVLTSVAGLFTLGFFPIIWFIYATTESGPSTWLAVDHLSVALLTLSLGMGMVQMGRCLATRNGMVAEAKPFPALLALWLALLVFITYRMATVLELV